MKRRKQVLVSESALDAIEMCSRSSAGTETGGILVGVHTDRGPWVTHSVEIASDDRSAVRYVLPANATGTAVGLARNSDPRVGYLGDWHSHPVGVHASVTDLRTMGVLARRLRRSHILLVAMPNEPRYEFDARWVSVVGDLPADLLRVGDLPAGASST